MLKKSIGIGLLAFAIILSGCGSTEESKPKPQPESPKTITSSDGSEWEVLKTVEGRDIIAELEQTTEETRIRDEKATKVVNQEDYKNGLFGKPSPDLAEEMTVQGIEGMVVIDAFNEVYGGYEGTANAGVTFFEWKSGGAKQSGIWIGIKNPDEKLNKLVSTLQEQVDNGEILAKYIYFYHAPHTEKEINTLTSTVFSSLDRVRRLHEKPDSVSASVSVDTITEDIEIGHDFITEDQKDILRKEFSDYKIVFEQEGKLVPTGDEPDITYPSDKTTTTPSTKGSYVVNVTDKGMTVVSAKARNYSGTGGKEEHFSAISVAYPDADKKLKVGQRVVVEYTGSISLSYPGQGRAKFVEVLPEYKPKNANLSESQVVKKAVEIADEKSTWVPAIRSIQYDEPSKVWKLSIRQGEETYELEIDDVIK
ncbi:DUF3221 domain-containing protein [Filibacter tadaridae]|uniref:DUF3221 domain-containing protein n=1 Tax=Filibacter tadaridae TaxID=2483811 RepID=A0A3P5WXZ9_9BACL|nr:DUF3221 domain-containing protein [Filibacter tadaridae]VDC23910.1 hypothetical protein FILTAD_00924 [Filibacter tadaridae]